jgi:hypothetical protein
MKRLIFVIVAMIYFGTSGLLSQSRTIQELPIITDIGKELEGVLGWSQDDVGRWVSSENKISIQSLEFERIRLRSIFYENNEYILFEIYENDHGYEYPSIRVGYYTYLSLNYFVIKPNDFIVRLRRNQSVTNKITPIVSSAVDSRFVEITDNALQHSIASDFIKNDNSSFGLEIFTFYYTDDNVVRFWINGPHFGSPYAVTKMPENYYFECGFDKFSAFFSTVIEQE